MGEFLIIIIGDDFGGEIVVGKSAKTEDGIDVRDLFEVVFERLFLFVIQIFGDNDGKGTFAEFI